MVNILDLSTALPITKDMIEAAIDTEKREYVDVRGIEPTYVHGMTACKLPNMPRDITVAQARIAAQKFLR